MDFPNILESRAVAPAPAADAIPCPMAERPATPTAIPAPMAANAIGRFNSNEPPSMPVKNNMIIAMSKP